MGIELLAPAGSEAALRAAVQSGADAVYLGGDKFGARQSAENFSAEEMKKWVKYCHLYGVDVHVTVNTLIKEREIPSLTEYVKTLNKIGVDALIVQDIGAADIIKSTLPDMTLHGSTQMTVTSLEGVRYLENMGFSRVVLARELSEKEIEYICKNAKAEIEVFVHGAICMCYSGQCLMSSILGGRSGNRGRCAQPCRLPYELVGDSKSCGSAYILSPKDMALVNELGTLKRIGVSSLKIEGRLKRAEYVSAVVGVYRRCLDEARRATEADMQELSDAFLRSGFTDGYFKGNLGKGMMSHYNPSNIGENKFTDEAKKRTLDGANQRKIPAGIIGTLKHDSPIELAMYDRDGNYATATGTLNAERALNKPLDKQRLEEQLLKLGATPFECTEINVTADEGITIPVKEINAVRRMAAEELIKMRQRREIGTEKEYSPPAFTRQKPDKIILTAQVCDYEQLKAAVKHDIKVIYAPQSVVGTLKTDAGTLKQISEKGIEIVTKLSEILNNDEISSDSVLVSSPAAIYKYDGAKKYGDFRLNVFNSQTAEHFSDLETVTVSPELNIHEIQDLCEGTRADIEVIGYGRLTLMLMKNCPVKAMGKCQNGKNIYKLRDRKNEEFPVMCGDGCIARLLNSKPIFMADKIGDLKKLKINRIRLIFTVEKFSQCDKIIYMYKRALEGAADEYKMADNTFTRGHFYRGVL